MKKYFLLISTLFIPNFTFASYQPTFLDFIIIPLGFLAGVILFAYLIKSIKQNLKKDLNKKEVWKENNYFILDFLFIFPNLFFLFDFFLTNPCRSGTFDIMDYYYIIHFELIAVFFASILFFIISFFKKSKKKKMRNVSKRLFLIFLFILYCSFVGNIFSGAGTCHSLEEVKLIPGVQLN